MLSEDDPTVLEPGMVISLHPHIYDGDHGAFAIDQYTITDGEPERHSRIARRLHEVG